MRFARVVNVVWGNVRRNKRAFILSSVGLVIGVATLTFFVHLGMGVQEGVLNKIYPVNQIEIEPRTVGIVGLREKVVDDARMGDDMVARFEALPDVTRVFPKLRSKFQARLWGGKALFGYAARAEAFFDGLEPALLRDELRANEGVEEKSARAELRRPVRCLRDEECPLGQECGDEGRCGDIAYWRRFDYHGAVIPCDPAEGLEAGCPPGLACAGDRCMTLCEGAEGRCGEGEACVPPPVCDGRDCPGVCASACDVDGDCPETHGCDETVTGDKVCRRLACTIDDPARQFSERMADLDGRLRDRCANGVPPDSPACEPLACPGRSYCAATSATTAAGHCEHPIPVVMSPVLLELFNSSASSSLGMRQIDGTDAMLGVRFRFHLGGSYFTADLPRERQMVRLAEVVGFSQKALEFGVTMPLDYVRAINARFKGRAAAETFDTFILETAGNEDVSRIINEIERDGFALSRKSEDAQKAADLLFILTVVFSFISLVIMGVAAVNIMHTFLTLVTERRYEIGIMRAVGARRRDIRRLFLVEASALGLFGGLIGNLLSWGATRLANLAAAEYLAGVPFRPDEFFAYDWRVMVGGVVFAWIFCLVGALIPANRAARLDPAVVLTS